MPRNSKFGFCKLLYKYLDYNRDKLVEDDVGFGQTPSFQICSAFKNIFEIRRYHMYYQKE